MKTFKSYIKLREAPVADDLKDKISIDDQEVFEIVAGIMKDAWKDDPDVVLDLLYTLESKKPGKYRTRIEEVKSKRTNPYGKGLDKPDDSRKPNHDIVRPVSDRAGDPGSS